MVDDIKRLNVKKLMTRELEYEKKDLVAIKEIETIRKLKEREHMLMKKRKQMKRLSIFISIYSFLLVCLNLVVFSPT